MGQGEVYELLKSRRKAGDNSYYCGADILNILDKEGDVYNWLKKLYAYGYLEIENTLERPWRYRLRRKCLKTTRAISPFDSTATAEELKATR